MQVEDRGGAGLEALQRAVQDLVQRANQQPGLVRVRSTFRALVPQVFVDVDRTQAKVLDVPLTSIFTRFLVPRLDVRRRVQLARPRVQVYVQAELRVRVNPDIRYLQVRNTDGKMVPFGTLRRSRRFGPSVISRFNLYPTAGPSPRPRPATSSGRARPAGEVASEMLPSATGFEWTACPTRRGRSAIRFTPSTA